MTEERIAGDVTEWLTSRAPDDWFAEPPRVLVDRDEIVIVVPLASAADGSDDDDGDEGSAELAEREQIVAFRRATREARIGLASQLEELFERKVSWVARCGGTTAAFTTLSLPVMTRLGFTERQVLDTLIAAGVAGSRSEALQWCVRHVAEHEGEWLDELRQALQAVDQVRARRGR